MAKFSEDWSRRDPQMVKNPPANAGHIRDAGLIPGLGRSPGGGHGNPLQYSGLENPMRDPRHENPRGDWQASLWGRKESDMTERLSRAQRRKRHRTQQIHHHIIHKYEDNRVTSFKD